MRLSLFVASLMLFSILAGGQIVQSGERESVTKTFIKTENVKLSDGSIVEVAAYLRNEGSDSKPACKVTIKYKSKSSADDAQVMALDCGGLDDAMRVLHEFKPWVNEKAAKIKG